MYVCIRIDTLPTHTQRDKRTDRDTKSPAFLQSLRRNHPNHHASRKPDKLISAFLKGVPGPISSPASPKSKFQCTHPRPPTTL